MNPPPTAPPLLRIASARGTPGTAGALVTGAGGVLCVLSNQHVMLGGGARMNDRLWAIPPDYQTFVPADAMRQAVCLGRVTSGQIGQVSYREDVYFVDCAVARITEESPFPTWLRTVLAEDCWPVETAPVKTGSLVWKYGAATGFTRGFLVDADYPDSPFIDGRSWSAPGQLLVESADRALNFAAPGDSGAALCAEDGRIIGLIWGSNPNGQGIACPIGPVLDCLGVRLAARRSVQQ